MSYVYIVSERPSQHNDWHGLWTVGFFDPRGEWISESDHGSAEEAAARVHYLNGGDAANPAEAAT